MSSNNVHTKLKRKRKRKEQKGGRQHFCVAVAVCDVRGIYINKVNLAKFIYAQKGQRGKIVKWGNPFWVIIIWENN